MEICWKEFIEVLVKSVVEKEDPTTGEIISEVIWEKVIKEITKCIDKPEITEDGYIPEHNPDDVYPIPNPNRFK